MAKPRILYIGSIPLEVGGKSVGGIATHCWQLATEAHKRGYEVYILANTVSSLKRDGISVIAPPQCNKLLKLFYAIKMWSSIDRKILNNLNFFSIMEKFRVLYGTYILRVIINSVEPDLIHIHSLHNIHTLSLKLIRNSIPLIITDHGFWQGFKSLSRYEGVLRKVKIIANLADCIIYISKFSKAQMDRYKVGQGKKKVLINNPVSPEKLPFINKQKVRNELGLPESKKILFFNGVSEPLQRKRLDLLMEGILTNDQLKRNCKLVVITNNEGLKFAKAYTSKIDVMALPSQPWEKVAKFYNAADVFVMPTKSESWGIVYGESLLVGTPLVGFYLTLNELEHILGIYIGEKFDAGKENEKDLAEKIIKVLNTDFDRELLRRKVIEKLSWDAKFGEFDSVYKEVFLG